MSIVIIRQDHKLDLWKGALQKAAPDIPVYTYLEKHPKQDITMAVVWKHPKGILDQYPNLKCIASSGAGVDFILEDSTVSIEIPVTRIVDPFLANDMSEHLIALVFAHLKNLTQYKQDQINKLWDPRPYQRILDLTIGVMGLGALGQVACNDLVRCGFKVQGWARSSKLIPNVNTYTGPDELSAFLEQSAILICLLPLTQETRGILNRKLFLALPKGAFIINVARGAHLVDDHLLELVQEGHLSGAALDVFHQEPLAEEHPFWEHPSIHITPHQASVTTIGSVVSQLVGNYTRLSKNVPLLNQVSRARGY